ncbi:MAG: PAS domain S-box protein [Rhodanobacteraceae bacterium]
MSNFTDPVDADAARGTRPLGPGVAQQGGLLEAVIGLTPECIKVVAPDGRLLHMNAAGLEMVGADCWDRVARASTFDLIAPECRLDWREHHERVCRGERLAWEFDIVGLNGKRRHMETHAAPIELDDGTVGQLAITRDIGTRLDHEAALHRVLGERTVELERALERLGETERSFALLVDSVTDYALFMLDTDGRIVSWNSGAQRIKGYVSSEIVDRHFSVFYTPEDRELGVPARGLETARREGRFETEGWRVRKDGSRFWANVIIDAIRDRGELVGFAKITRDITERKATETRLREAQKMEAVGQFTGGAAHDFNNLLMAIIGSLELLRKRIPGDTALNALLDTAMQGAQRGATLTQRMLAFARRQELKREAVNVHRLTHGMKEFLEQSMGDGIDVEIAVPRLLSAVSTDANQLETALQNLALNARDAMPHGGRIRITANEERLTAPQTNGLMPGAYVCISVADAGEGMDEATLARATQPFFTTKGVGKGTGLGLSMVDGLAAQSGGKLIVHSKLGTGTTVELWLPIAEAGMQDESASAAAIPASEQPCASALVVLAVDDDSLVLMNMTAMLEDLGHTVIAAGSGAKALEILDAGTNVDLVISDQAMPGMTGAQLFKAIRARRPELPSVLATGFAELPAGTEAPSHRLAKPFTQRELADAIADAAR